MTPEEKRIAIARVCLPDLEKWTEEDLANGWRCISPPNTPICDTEEIELPDYLNDLNAMHEAALAQDETFWFNFPWAVEQVLCKERAYSLKTADFLKATAAQWAEAFLLTKGFKL